MNDLVILAAVAFAVTKTVSTIKAASNGDWPAVITQFLVWAVGTGAIMLIAEAEVTSALVLPGSTTAAGSLDFASKVMLGWLFGSSGSFAFDFRAAVDNQDTARELPLKTGLDNPEPAHFRNNDLR